MTFLVIVTASFGIVVGLYLLLLRVDPRPRRTNPLRDVKRATKTRNKLGRVAESPTANHKKG